MSKFSFKNSEISPIPESLRPRQTFHLTLDRHTDVLQPALPALGERSLLTCTVSSGGHGGVKMMGALQGGDTPGGVLLLTFPRRANLDAQRWTGLADTLSLRKLQAWGGTTDRGCSGRSLWSDHPRRLRFVEPPLPSRIPSFGHRSVRRVRWWLSVVLGWEGSFQDVPAIGGLIAVVSWTSWSTGGGQCCRRGL